MRPLNRTPGAARGPGLNREAAASISQVIVTLTLLLANAGPTTGFLTYSCGDLRSPVIGYELTPQEGCWMKQPAYATPVPRDGRIVWMREWVRFPVICCKMTETVMQADCDSGGGVRPWRIVTMELHLEELHLEELPRRRVGRALKGNWESLMMVWSPWARQTPVRRLG